MFFVLLMSCILNTNHSNTANVIPLSGEMEATWVPLPN